MSTTIMDLSGGTGRRLGHIAIVLAGVSALAATLLTVVSVWLQSKNYRKPLLQRYVIRILCMVPIYCAASWASLVSRKVAFWISPFRDVYEAFVIYAFFQLLINFIGGERALIILMHGRKPVSHPWPLSQVLSKVDISDPHTFLAIKRGILQYTWLKPMLSVATIIMQATGTYQEGYIGLTSGYLWSGLIYNISITICLYALAMFWVCMTVDLQPFRPMPKFISIKGIIFASYWQGFFLSILVWLGAIPENIPGYSPDNLAASIQDALICFEMPLFALLHWFAFSWHDYADVTISAARMPVKHALRDAFGTVDLIQDARETLAGNKYGYRYFDADDNVLAHEESHQRTARMNEGMRYERGGKGKYWIPNPHEATAKTPLLGKLLGQEERPRSPSTDSNLSDADYGTTPNGNFEQVTLDADDEELYTSARALEYGDWNYPVITAHQPTREDRLYRKPGIITASTNRHLLQPTKANTRRRQSRITDIRKSVADKGKGRGSGGDYEGEEGEGTSSRGRSAVSHVPVLGGLLEALPGVGGGSEERSASKESHSSQLVDLVVEDKEAEAIERVRARKEGSPGWNRHESRHFVRTSAEDTEEAIEDPDIPTPSTTQNPASQHEVDPAFAIGDDDDGGDGENQGDNEDGDDGGVGKRWKTRNYGAEHPGVSGDRQIGGHVEFHDDSAGVWGSPSGMK